MKMKNQVNTAALVMGIGLIAGNLPAVTLTDAWSGPGGAWTGASQTEWVSDNLLHPDAASNNGAVLHSSVRPTATSSAPLGGLYDGFFYSFFSTPTLTLSTDNVLAGMDTLTLSISLGGQTSIDDVAITLNYNPGNPALAPDTRATGPSVIASSPIGDMELTTYTYTWLVGARGPSEGLSLSWNIGVHTAISQIELTQSAASSAVPEPATYAAIVGGLVLAGVILARRRKT